MKTHGFLFATILTEFLLILSLNSEEAKSQNSCGLVTDSIVDYGIQRFLSNESARVIPDLKTSSVDMSRGKLYGLNTIRRACPIQVTRSKLDSSSLAVAVCVKAGLIRFTANVQVKTIFGFKIPEFIDVSIDGVEMKAGVQADVRVGGSLKLDEFDITKLGEITLDNAGLLGSFDKIINLLINTKIKKVVIHFVEKGIKGAVEDELKKIIL